MIAFPTNELLGEEECYRYLKRSLPSGGACRARTDMNFLPIRPYAAAAAHQSWTIAAGSAERCSTSSPTRSGRKPTTTVGQPVMLLRGFAKGVDQAAHRRDVPECREKRQLHRNPNEKGHRSQRSLGRRLRRRRESGGSREHNRRHLGKPPQPTPPIQGSLLETPIGYVAMFTFAFNHDRIGPELPQCTCGL